MTGRPIVLQELEYTDQEVKVLTEKLLDVCSSFNITLTSRQAQDLSLIHIFPELSPREKRYPPDNEDGFSRYPRLP